MLSGQRVLLALSCILCLGLMKHLWGLSSGGQQRSQQPVASGQTLSANHSLATEPASTRFRDCQSSLPGLEDVLVVLKTGATELYEKLPIHLATTFACFGDYLVYSDVEQNIGHVPVHDALALVSQELRRYHPDLEQYNALQQHVTIGGDSAELKGDKSWGLDKYKFSPMISDAHRRVVRNKWLVFIEADTYLSVHNLLLWLAQLDSEMLIYAGAQVMIGDTEFAHGGSGFVLSTSAAEKLAEVYAKGQFDWENKLAGECCGDKIMAEVLLQASPPIKLHKSFPIIQGETLTSLDWSHTHWCCPAVTWHHADAAAIDKLWQFEQRWHTEHGADKPILFADYFDHFIHPRLIAANGTMNDWDNLSNDWVFERGKLISPTYETAANCEAFCLAQGHCLQWAWSPGICRAGRAVRLGWALDHRPALGSADDRVAQAGAQGTEGAVSGWLLGRIGDFKA